MGSPAALRTPPLSVFSSPTTSTPSPHFSASPHFYPTERHPLGAVHYPMASGGGGGMTHGLKRSAPQDETQASSPAGATVPTVQAAAATPTPQGWNSASTAPWDTKCPASKRVRTEKPGMQGSFATPHAALATPRFSTPSLHASRPSSHHEVAPPPFTGPSPSCFTGGLPPRKRTHEPEGDLTLEAVDVNGLQSEASQPFVPLKRVRLGQAADDQAMLDLSRPPPSAQSRPPLHTTGPVGQIIDLDTGEVLRRLPENNAQSLLTSAPCPPAYQGQPSLLNRRLLPPGRLSDDEDEEMNGQSRAAIVRQIQPDQMSGAPDEPRLTFLVNPPPGAARNGGSTFPTSSLPTPVMDPTWNPRHHDNHALVLYRRNHGVEDLSSAMGTGAFNELPKIYELPASDLGMTTPAPTAPMAAGPAPLFFPPMGPLAPSDAGSPSTAPSSPTESPQQGLDLAAQGGGGMDLD
ncbi:hypothetical protein IWQ60_007543 [Tieghemiomyces parasiticus]|uniref:Uncharacterized protein n=1 Tax=Tieghemiomyces parasiticus TaxID=78921 RepID=A0A9W8DU11_9FUNG|nr:hypothetical protein IWQ60_007543 [Tieghemiomyces parasiticus]